MSVASSALAPAAAAGLLPLQVAQVQALTPRIRRLLLQPAEGGTLPPYAPGAHLRLQLPASLSGGGERAYSLVRPHQPGAGYELAVQLEPAGQGGSAWVHTLRPGDRVLATPPVNQFALPGPGRRPRLLAGGIGITPLLCMALALQQQGRPGTLHYLARAQAQAAYAAEVQALPGAALWLDQGQPALAPPMATLIGPWRHPDDGQPQALLVCGPRGLIEAALACARGLGWPDEDLHAELFSAPPATASAGEGAEAGFELQLAASGRTLQVPPGTSVLQVLEQAGLEPLADCRRGDCGVCVARVLAGEPEHRDICLSPREREAGQFCPCVSRARSARLVLDL